MMGFGGAGKIILVDGVDDDDDVAASRLLDD